MFDNAFHSTMPPEAYMFGLPYEYYENTHSEIRLPRHFAPFCKCSLRRGYGRRYQKLKIVTCHLGNGSSITAVKYGKCIDTSMGLTPLDGEIMGTRTGSIDPSAVLYIMKKRVRLPMK